MCTSAFGAGASKDVTFKCSYTNPSTGSLPVRIGGNALNAAGNAAAACDGTGKAVTLSFVTSGSTVAASTPFRYADAGQVQITASYAGGVSEPGLNISGTKNVIVAPASFGLSAITSGPIKAGSSFGVTVTARNSLNNKTSNFGKESPPAKADVTFVRRLPTGTGVSNGTFAGTLGAFDSGVASSTDLSWSEVGTGDLAATLAGGNYLASGTTLVTTGSTGVAGSVGPFIPDRFKVEAVNACSSGFSFNDQPFTVQVTAQNSSGITTVNHGAALPTSVLIGSTTYATKPDVTLDVVSASPVVTNAALQSGAVTGASFVAGVGKNTAVRYKFDKLSPPTTIGLRSTASFGSAGSTVSVVSSGMDNGSMALRSGRLKISNVFGSEKSGLDMMVQSQYWSASKAWVINALDSCTNLPATAVVLSGYRDNKGQSTVAWTTTATPSGALSNGTGKITFSAPSPVFTGSVDVALNLGDPNAADVSCLANHGGTGAAMSWLRSQNGNCAVTFDRDPSARVTFGIYKPESTKTIHVREIY